MPLIKACIQDRWYKIGPKPADISKVTRGYTAGWMSPQMDDLAKSTRRCLALDAGACMFKCQDGYWWHWDWVATEVPGPGSLVFEKGKRYKIVKSDPDWSGWSPSKEKMIGFEGLAEAPASVIDDLMEGSWSLRLCGKAAEDGGFKNARWYFRPISCVLVEAITGSACACDIRCGPCVCGAFEAEMRLLGRTYDQGLRTWIAPRKR